MAHLPRVAIVLLVLVSVSGCSTPADAPEGPTVITSDAAPEEFTARTPLASCGTIVLDQGGEIPAEALDCIATATGAELVVTAPTTEGDPITTYYRMTEAGLEIWTDSSQDQWSNEGWTHQNCPDAASISDLGECVPA